MPRRVRLGPLPLLLASVGSAGGKSGTMDIAPACLSKERLYAGSIGCRLALLGMASMVDHDHLRVSEDQESTVLVLPTVRLLGPSLTSLYFDERLLYINYL